jgi:hypothetical protein
MVDSLIHQLDAPDGKVKYLFSINPGGPIFELSVPMKKLVEKGRGIQPGLLNELKDPRRHNEVALVLARIGDKDALPGLIEGLPTKEKLTADEDFTCMRFLYALWQLTGMELGIHHKFSPKYTPEFRANWQAWYEANKDYLYSPSKPRLTTYSWGWDRVLVDQEAKLAAMPTDVYRREHAWIPYEEIKIWRNAPDYEQKLKNFCFSIILNLTWNPHGLNTGEGLPSLRRVRDPRALSALHTLCGMADVSIARVLIWVLGEKGNPSSIPYLEKIPRSKDEETRSDSIERARLDAIRRIRLLQKYSKELEGKPFDTEQQTYFMECLEGPKGVEDLIAWMCKPDQDCFLPLYLRVAAYVDQEPTRSFLRDMVRDNSRNDRSKAMVHAALAQLGEKDSVDYSRGR